jgi:hypothetical protein
VQGKVGRGVVGKLILHPCFISPRRADGQYQQYPTYKLFRHS